ncbi:hypothetical protein DL93DRAFT_2091671 [Clavulina sp. PMI_390]|nr:hypothetical protein DL93DRAFT_2091671 [Clavulina sp. PMI_390]
MHSAHPHSELTVTIIPTTTTQCLAAALAFLLCSMRIDINHLLDRSGRAYRGPTSLFIAIASCLARTRYCQYRRTEATFIDIAALFLCSFSTSLAPPAHASKSSPHSPLRYYLPYGHCEDPQGARGCREGGYKFLCTLLYPIARLHCRL